MASTAAVHFPPFALDVGNAQLWQGKQQIPLRPKPFAILRYLVENAGRLVTKEELLKAIWPQTYVSEGLLHTYLRDLRHVLGDNPEAPRFIETVVRRGYRFIAPLTLERTTELSARRLMSAETAQAISPSGVAAALLSPTLVGREAALASLQRRLAQTLKGVRQVVFVTGEPGIGKTTLIDAFLEQVSATRDIWIGRGQCVGQYGTGEAYLPTLEALGRLGRTAAGERFLPLLRRHAPSWLVQLPALLGDTELEELQRKIAGVTKERMLRELAEALEILTAEQPLALVLEDLHWSDRSTVDLLSAIAQRREAARLLVLGTYRPADIIMSGHPLRAVIQELQLHSQCTELPLTFLSSSDVIQYLSVRFPQHHFPQAFGPKLQQHTEGNPLFLVTTLEDLVRRQMVVEQDGQWQLHTSLNEIVLGAPSSVQQLIVRQLERLSGEQQVLEAASVAGVSFSAAAVAAGLERELTQVEACCEGLARREQFLQAQELETWLDGTIAGRYRFTHALYQQVVYEQIGAARRVQFHRRIGERLEAGYDTQTSEIAAELALHFEQGQDKQKAVQYLERAAQNAILRSATVEAIRLLTKGLELLSALPNASEHPEQELTLQVLLGVGLMATRGYATPEVERSFARVQELCLRLGETPQLFRALPPLRGFRFVRGELQAAREVAEQHLLLAQRVQHPVLQVWASYGLGETLLFCGELAAARTHLEQGIASYDPQQTRAFFVPTVQDPGVACLTHTSTALWYLGYPDQALKRVQEARTLAQELSHPFSLAWALYNTARHHQLRREGHLAQEWAEAGIQLAREQGFPFWLAASTIIRGWALAERGQSEEGNAQIRQGLLVYRATGVKILLPYYLALLAEVQRKEGQTEEGLNILAEALAQANASGERWYEAELYRLRGELTLQSTASRGQASHKSRTSRRQVQNKSRKSQNKSGTDPRSPTPDPYSEAEACFLKAIAIAQQQQAKSLELRAAMSLSRLWQQQGKREEARQLLAEIYGWFTEGFDTKDLQEAKTLLEEFT